MSGQARRLDLNLSRLAFWVLATALAVIALVVLNDIGTRAIEARVGQNLDAVADSDRARAESSLDFGLPAKGPGSVEELLQPPAALTTGPDALSLRLEKLQVVDDGNGRIMENSRRRVEDAMIAERIVSDSHGEPTARLYVSRSMVGIDSALAARDWAIAIGLALSSVLLAVLLIFFPPWRAIRVPGILFVGGICFILFSLGSQAADISRQAATLAVADTAGHVERAIELGIPFGRLVGMLDYLNLQVASKPAIGAIEVRGPDGVTYAAGADPLGSMLADWLSRLSLSGFVNLGVEQVLGEGVKLKASVNILPILAEIGAFALVGFIFCVSGGAMLQALWPSDGQTTRAAVRSTLPLGLFFLLLFFGWGGPSALSAVSSVFQFAGIAAAFVIGLALQRRVRLFPLAIVIPAGLTGLWFDGLPLMLAAAMTCGLGFHWNEEGAKPAHLGAALLPSVCVAGIAAIGFTVDVSAAKVAIILLAALVFLIAERQPKGGNLRPPMASKLSMRTLLDNWIWICLFAMQTAGFLLLALGARQMPASLFDSSGPALYLLVTAVLYAAGGLLAGLVGAWWKVRWVLFELAVLAAALVIAHAYAGNGPIFVNTAIAAVLMGAVGRWMSQLPFTLGAGHLRSARVLASGLAAFAAAGAIAAEIALPRQAALPAILVYLVMLAPLAFTTIAGMRIRPRRMFSGSAG